MPTDTERLDWLATQSGAALVNDDFGRWVVSYDGIQSVPDDIDVPSDIKSIFFIDAYAWRPGVRAAIDAAMNDHT